MAHTKSPSICTKSSDPFQIPWRPPRSGAPSVSVAPSEYWRQSLDKQSVAHLRTRGPSRLLGMFQFLRYPIQSRIGSAFYSQKHPLVSWRNTFTESPYLLQAPRHPLALRCLPVSESPSMCLRCPPNKPGALQYLRRPPVFSECSSFHGTQAFPWSESALQALRRSSCDEAPGPQQCPRCTESSMVICNL